MHDQHFLGKDLVEARERAHRLARRGSCRSGEHEAKLPAGTRELADQPVVLRDRLQLDALTRREARHEPETDVVAVPFVVLGPDCPRPAMSLIMGGYKKGAEIPAPFLRGGMSALLLVALVGSCRLCRPCSSAAGAAASGAFCLTVGTSAAAGTASAAAATLRHRRLRLQLRRLPPRRSRPSGSAPKRRSDSRCRPAPARRPCGMATSRTWIEWPIEMFDRSTWMNSGRSAGRQRISTSFSTWVIEAALLLDRRRFLGVDEVQRHLDVDLLVGRRPAGSRCAAPRSSTDAC